MPPNEKSVDSVMRALESVETRNSANPARTIKNYLTFISSSGSDHYAKGLIKALTAVRNHKKGSGAFARAGKGMSLSEISEQAALLLMASHALRYLPGPNLVELLCELLNARGRRAQFQRKSSPRETAREILKWEPDIGVRQLADRVGVSPSTVSRWNLRASSRAKGTK